GQRAVTPGGKPKSPAHPCRGGTKPLLQCFELPQHGPAAIEIDLPFGWGAQPSLRAADERESKPSLQRRDLGANGVWRHAEPACGADETPRFENVDEDGYLIDSHNHILQ